MVYPMHNASESAEVRPSTISLSDDLVRILVTDHGELVDLAAAGPQEVSGGRAVNAPPPDADYLVMSSLTFDEHGDYSITLRLVRADDRTIVWADTKHLPTTDLAAWPDQAATDIVQALASLPSTL